MGKKGKYSAQILTVDDKYILEKVVFKYAVKLYNLIEKYHDPKEYAQKEILKIKDSDRDVAMLFTLGYLKNYQPNFPFRPGQINQKLANDIRNAIQQNYKEIVVLEEEQKSKGFLSPKDLREVLKKLEKEGIILRLEGKKEIKSHQHNKSRPRKKLSLGTNHDDRGGKPSAYIITEEVKKVKEAMEKPDALDYLYDKIIRSGLAHKLAKFQFSALLHAAKMDETVLQLLMGAGAAFSGESFSTEDTTYFKLLHKSLQLYDDNQLDQYADNIAKNAIEDRGYYALLFMAGLQKY